MNLMISIIIPVYNAEKTLPKCLDSIIDQTIFDMLEVLIIDDGSTDGSAEVIKQYTDKYTSFKCARILNEGVSNARNVGLDMALGEYIAFVDADDYIEPDFFQIMLDKMQPDADIVCSGFIAEYPNMQIPRQSDKEYDLSKERAIEEFLKANIIDYQVCDKLFRRKVIGDCRFDKRFRISEDKLFLYHCIKNIKKMRVLNVCKYHYVMRDDSACRAKFSEKNLDSFMVTELILQDIRTEFKDKYPLAESAEMDVICRVYGDLYFDGIPEEYRSVFNDLKKRIKTYSIAEKRKYSSKKHFIAFLAARIHPRLYTFLKKDMKFQYRN